MQERDEQHNLGLDKLLGGMGDTTPPPTPSSSAASVTEAKGITPASDLKSVVSVGDLDSQDEVTTLLEATSPAGSHQQDAMAAPISAVLAEKPPEKSSSTYV